MLKVEQELLLPSVCYVDVHSPSYDLQDIIDLYNDFSFISVGIHINTAYDYKDPWNQYINDVENLRKYIDVHSCVGHFYSEKMVKKPKYTNVDIEKKSDETEGMPDSFLKTFFGSREGVFILRDSGGIITMSINMAAKKNIKVLQTHPVYYVKKQGGVEFLGGIGRKKKPDKQEINHAQDKLVTTPYLKQHLEKIGHMSYFMPLLKQIVNQRYKKLIRLVDVGCGIGLLGAHLLEYNNVKYFGVDVEPDFINTGKQLFESLGYGCPLYCGDVYKDELPDGDILVMLAYEDCPTDYYKLHEVLSKYDEILITIISKKRFEEGKKRGKKYWYIDPGEFEKIFKDYKIIKKIEKSRILYWLSK
jgi:hypothetical protein